MSWWHSTRRHSARTTDLSPDINFKAAVPHFEEMLDVCKQLSERDLSRLTHEQLSTMSSAFDQLSSLITQVKEFTLNQNTPGDVCKAIVASIANAYDDVMNPLLLPWRLPLPRQRTMPRSSAKRRATTPRCKRRQRNSRVSSAAHGRRPSGHWRLLRNKRQKRVCPRTRKSSWALQNSTKQHQESG